jgi:hypothetical protein
MENELSPKEQCVNDLFVKRKEFFLEEYNKDISLIEFLNNHIVFGSNPNIKHLEHALYLANQDLTYVEEQINCFADIITKGNVSLSCFQELLTDCDAKIMQ